MTTKTPRYHALDGARGVAAFAVVLCHCLSRAYRHPEPSSLQLNALKAFLTLGHLSVIFFFVLSGFALGIRYTSGKNTSYWRFQLSRLARLVPCVAAVVATATILRLMTPDLSVDMLSGAFVDLWKLPINGERLARHVLLIGVSRMDTDLDPPLWSLVYEMRAGLFIPLFMYSLKRYSLYSNIILLIALYASSSISLSMFGLPNPVFYGETLFGSLLATFHYLGSFLLGCVICHCLHQGEGNCAPNGARRFTLLMVMAFLAFWLGGIITHSDLLLSLAAACAIFCILRIAPLQQGLELAPIQFLGKISYSLYLVHMPVSLAVLRLTGGAIGDGYFLIIAPTLSVIAATVLFAIVERPSIALSRTVGRQGKASSPGSQGGRDEQRPAGTRKSSIDQPEDMQVQSQ
ncbi:acyltransferase [Rhizobium sp. IBUN]|uniref:acyltransferase family protein n=1 Tax=Rhizobium sp. IBUN TaxID=1042326 RepID=UPI0003F64E21|nr:acyltransferase [Rhizobium sp. IBUN]